MADITLAEFQGQVWLVGGEDYLNVLLANELPEGKTIEIVPCEMQSDVHELWMQHSASAERDELMGIEGMPWQIHPNIIARIKRSALGFVVIFAEWSVKLDADSQRVIASAAHELREKLEVEVTVVSYEDPAAATAVLAIDDLRVQMVVDMLISEQVAAGRIRRDRRDKSTATDGPTKDRVDIIMGVS